jgi:hypothetical protein
MTVAQNWDLPNRTLLAKRRGVARRSSSPVAVPRSMFFAGTNTVGGTPAVVTSCGLNTTVGTATTLYRDATAITLPAPRTPTLTDPSIRPARFSRFGTNIYATTDHGVARIERNWLGLWAGVERPRAIASAPWGTGRTGAWLAVGDTVLYRVVIVRYDYDGKPMRGAPSGVAQTKNTTAAAATVGVYVSLHAVNSTATADPANVRRIDVEVYRSPASSTGTPSEELQLAYRRTLTAAEKASSAYIFIEDLCPDAALGAYLYTNGITGDEVLSGSAVGLASRNDIPPVASDVAVFAERMWLADLTYRHEMTFSLFAPGVAGYQLKAGDVLTVDGVAYTAGAQFTVFTAGTLLENIRDTAQSIVDAINVTSIAGADIQAEYIGSPLSPGTAGLIRVWRRMNASASFTAQITAGGSGGAFTPDLTTALTSASESIDNGLAYSKASQPDAFPPVNVIRVGQGDAVIRRIVALRDALFIFASDGLWRLTGYSPETFALEQFDTSVRLSYLMPSHVAVMDDAIYAWTNLGVVRITTSGVELIDDQIRDFVRLQGQHLGGFAVADTVAKRVLFFLGTPGTGMPYSFAHRALVYQARTGAWTLYHYGAASPKTCAAADPDKGIIYLGNADDGAGTVYPGGEVYEYAYAFGSGVRYGAISYERNTNAASDWVDTNNANASQAITSVAKWTSAVPDPMVVAQWRELHLFTSPSDIQAAMGAPSTVDVAFDTEMTSETTVTSSVPLATQTRVMVPRDAARGARMTIKMTHAVSSEYSSLSGFGLVYEPDGTEVAR